jgi:hypothetical protein
MSHPVFSATLKVMFEPSLMNILERACSRCVLEPDTNTRIPCTENRSSGPLRFASTKAVPQPHAVSSMPRATASS